MTEGPPGFDIDAINDRGEFAGTALFGDIWSAAIWTNGGAIRLSNERSYSLAINNSAWVIGGVSDDATETATPYLWRQGVAINLGAFSPVDINDRGQLLGFLTTPEGSRIPALWRNGMVIDLTDYGVFSVWDLAGRINNRGDIIFPDKGIIASNRTYVFLR